VLVKHLAIAIEPSARAMTSAPTEASEARCATITNPRLAASSGGLRPVAHGRIACMSCSIGRRRSVHCMTTMGVSRLL